VTVNPYLGTDSVEPFFEHSENDGGGVIVLCRTSNPGGDDFQSLVTAPEHGSKPLYMHVAERVANEWSQLGDCGLVVGATYPVEIAEIRAAAPGLPFLVPGVGAQGGDAATVVEQGADATSSGLIVSSSRAVLYASNGEDFADAARAEAKRTAASLTLTNPGNN
jgi:orotidine-5'-phosphate decarboxylase